MTILNFSLLIDFQAKEINVTEHPLWSCVLGAYEERREIAKKTDTTPLTELTPATAGDLREAGSVLGALQVVLEVKNPLANAGDARDMGLILGLGRSPEVGNDTPLQYSCLENSMDRGAWLATVHGVIKSWTQLSD